MNWNELQVGNSAKFSKTFSDEDVRQFAQLSGDQNPMHVDDDFAKTSRFGKRIVHGALTSGLISAVLGNILPGSGTIYLRQTLVFRKPVFIGDTCTAFVEVTGKNEKRQTISLKTWVVNQLEDCVLEGEAEVLPPI